ncbi:MAG TPA: family 43 glycosylhydrolase [Sphingomonas sp.]|uniref:arabinan endo-1,5-alpha-L-arabinosidase n=1 Tax=Sphingomonas sp. TaxID=28214 RepID=UPI002EDA72AE
MTYRSGFRFIPSGATGRRPTAGLDRNLARPGLVELPFGPRGAAEFANTRPVGRAGLSAARRVLPWLMLLGLAGCGGDDGGATTSDANQAPVATPTPAPSPSPSPGPSPGPLVLTGATAPVHDPAILKDNGTYYLFATGNNGDAEGLLALRTSTDLAAWRFRGASFRQLPAWTAEAVPNAAGMWAPDIVRHGNEYRLYYSVSTFGSNRSAIGLATASALDAGAPATNWVDKGPVIRSSPADDYNAIDSMVFIDAEGRSWMVFGSFFSGIKLIGLDPATGLRLAGDPVRPLAARPSPGAVEAPFVVRRGGFYYLFVSFDFCCQGARSSYNTVVGRASSPTGPYMDRDGRAMMNGGGTPVLASGQGEGGRFVGRGHVAILDEGDAQHIVYHAYDTQRNGVPTLQIQRLAWDAAGWPRAD